MRDREYPIYPIKIEEGVRAMCVTEPICSAGER
jgi:hypothetical protein